MIAAPGSLHDFRTNKKPKPNPRPALPPTVSTTSANGQAREDMPGATTQLKEGDWRGLTNHILQELRERFGPSGGGLPGATETFLCEVLSAILLRLYRAYSMEKLFGEGNSGPKGAVKDAIEQDNQEMSFEALSAFADFHGRRPIGTVKGNRVPRKEKEPIFTGNQLFDCMWGDGRHWMTRTHWDTAAFREQYRRIRHELNTPGPAQRMRQKLQETLRYRFLQSQTVFSYPDPNGTFASTAKLAHGERARRVWYHQTCLPREEVSMVESNKVKRCNNDPIEDGEGWKPVRLPKIVQSWELVISHCKEHRLHVTSG